MLCSTTPNATLMAATRNTVGGAAELALDLQGVLFKVTDERLNLLVEAIAKHADGLVTEDPTIACCWDADRLDLPRCGIQTNPALLSTPAARRRIGAA